MWNLGFKALFPKYTTHGIKFPISQAMEIELGLMGAVALMGIAVQLRVLQILQRKLKEIAEDQKRRNAEEEAKAAERFRSLERERDDWEKEHPTLGSRDRQQSALSGVPLLKDHERPDSPASPPTEAAGSTWDLPTRRRLPSGLSDYNGRRSQSPGAIPALDLGDDIEENVPSDFLAPDRQGSSSVMPSTSNTSEEDIRKKEQLLAEINSIRKSIEVLKDEGSQPSRSRRPSMASRRTLSTDLYNTLVPEPSHLRPPRARDPRTRTQSMEMSDLVRQYQLGETTSRPTSVPLKDDWDSYVNDRKLLQPPSGVSPPIATSPAPDHRGSVSPAVAEALKERRKRESALELGQIRQPSPVAAVGSSSMLNAHERVPSRSPDKGIFSDIGGVETMQGHARQKSGSSIAPLNILPPQKVAAPQPQRPVQPRTKTFEELAERHREKIRDLQAPLSQAEKERAELETAKARWERSKALERDAVTRRQAEKEKAAAKKPQEGLERPGRRSATMEDRGNGDRHSRSLSADKLAALGTVSSSSRRASTMKVEDWQRYQQEAAPAPKRVDDGRRQSNAFRSASTSVPFPDPQARRMSTMPRDPPA
jgi:hypothetical protein